MGDDVSSSVPITLPDGRPVPRFRGDERAMPESWLEYHRATLALKCAGLDDAQVRLASAEPSALTLLGLVQHLAEVERNWFQRIVAGRDVPPVFDDVTGFALDPARGIDEALAAWHREIARGRELTEGLPLDGTGLITDGPMAGVEVSLRWVLIHLIEEYARHNGHADLLRERIDGVTGS
ncbi:putative damage-inducible protein DinB [Streptomyces sp. T12]|uniref:DinB family protein n=1 Tax=Streptomyces sp. T12 TaxID=477697 RepID=UPI00119D85F2|nr:DinB family protein [Streptomyces sp. T12]TWD26914.1 putative damage-inducible protein DinB [Streptomyces sp. T12]